MRKRGIVWGLGLTIIVVVGAAALIQRREPRPFVELSDGTRLIFLKATYGRLHQHTEWRFQWAWPPVRREVYRVSAPKDALRLWFRIETAPRNVGFRPLQVQDGVAVTTDGRLCGGFNFIGALLLGPEPVRCSGYEGLAADGVTVELRFYDFSGGNSYRTLKVRLPKAPILDQVKQPETMPAQRTGKLLTVRLNRFDWLYRRWKSATFIPKNEEQIYACPDWQLTPLAGRLNEWEVANIHFAPLGSGPLHAEMNKSFGASPQSILVAVEGSWSAPIYSFWVQFVHKPTGRRESFEFYVPPPPVEQLRRRGRLETQARAAIQQGDYSRAVKVWENAPAEFALQAHYWRGYAYAMQRDYARAVQEFRQAARFLRSLTSSYDNEYEVRPALALCLLLMGRRADAAQVAREFVEQVYQERECLWEIEPLAWGLCVLLPETAPSPERIEQRAREWVQLGRLHSNRAYLEMAFRARAVQAAVERNYTRALRLYPEAPTQGLPVYDLLLLGWLHQHWGQRADARLYLELAQQSLQLQRSDQAHLNGTLLRRALLGDAARR